jgi:hypothetical protein
VSGQDLFLGQRTQSQAAVDASGSIHTCLKSCLDVDESKHFKNCIAAGATDCSASKCCQRPQDTCFVKNAYWAACLPYCKTGIPDFTGETWACIPLSPSGCHHLQMCVDECAPGLKVSASNSTVIDLELEDITDELHEMEPSSEKVTGEELAATDSLSKSKCPNKKGLGACVRSCKSTGVGPDHGSHCEEDGRTSCSSSKCCQKSGDKCFTKNPYWASCTNECTPGKPSKLDNQIWDCKELKPKQVCDPYKYRTCVETCVEEC